MLLHERAACSYVYGRILIVTCGIPVIVVAFPLILSLLNWFLSFWAPYPMLTVATTVFLARTANHAIAVQRFSSKKVSIKNYRVMLQMQKWIVPVSFFAARQVFQLSLVGRFVDSVGGLLLNRLASILLPEMTTLSAIRVAFCFLVLGLAVALRFLSPSGTGAYHKTACGYCISQNLLLYSPTLSVSSSGHGGRSCHAT